MTSLPGFTPTYDANGNLLNDSLHIYSWDAEGRPVAVDSVTLTYDALGRMVEQNRSGVYSQIAYAPTGNKLAIMSGQTLQKAFVPLPAGAQAVYTSAGLSYYRHPDWLGSSRLASTPARAVYYDGGYAPFGESYAEMGTTSRSFTGQNQDTVTGLYDFLFREYSPSQGRWVSPDPAGLAAVSAANPQSWNRYAYVGNTPLTATDPLGLLRDVVGLYNICYMNGFPTNCVVVFNFALIGQGSSYLGRASTPIRYRFDVTSGMCMGGEGGGWCGLLGFWTPIYPAFDPTAYFNAYYAALRANQKKQASTVPTTDDYLKAIADALAKFPNICDVGAFGIAGGSNLGVIGEIGTDGKRAGFIGEIGHVAATGTTEGGGDVSVAPLVFLPIPATRGGVFVEPAKPYPFAINSVGPYVQTTPMTAVGVYGTVRNFFECK